MALALSVILQGKNGIYTTIKEVVLLSTYKVVLFKTAY